MITLPIATLHRTIRGSAIYDQRDVRDRINSYKSIATAIAIQPGQAHTYSGGGDGDNHLIGYDLLLVGTQSSLKARRGNEEKPVLFVAILPHIKEEERKPEMGTFDDEFTLFQQSTSVSLPHPPQPQPHRSVVIHSTYGPAPVASQEYRHRRRRHRSSACQTFIKHLTRIVTHPIASITSLLSPASSSLDPLHSYHTPIPPSSHYPKLASLASHGLSLQERPWLWQDQPFYGLELVWQEDEDEDEEDSQHRADEEDDENATLLPVSSSSSSSSPSPSPPLPRSRRQLPIHPSHLCIDPTSGEIVITDHERHAVYSIRPCWITRQKLKELTSNMTDKVEKSSDEGITSTSACASTSDSWSLPLPDVLLDIVVDYVGNQVRLLAGESNVKGCRDGESSIAHFNAPSGVTVHPTSGQIFVTDGHWNSRICTLTAKKGTGVGSTPIDSIRSSSTLPPSSPPPPRWNVASLPLHPSNPTLARRNTWWSSVRHEGRRYEATSLWPLRLPTSPIVLQQPSLPTSSADRAKGDVGTDALFLLDEELHLLRMIPLTGESSGHISTVSGSFGIHGLSDGWSAHAKFLFPQSIISIQHPLSNPRIARSHPRNMLMKDRQCILVADTGNDRICMVNLITKEEIRQERRKQRMLKRQMKAIEAINRAQRNSDAVEDDSPHVDDGGDDDDDDDDSLDLADSDLDDGALDEYDGPLVGHVETIRLHGLVPKEMETHFIVKPWTPESNMKRKRMEEVKEEEEVEEEKVSHSSTSSPSPTPSSSSSSSSSPSSHPSSLPPCPYVHRGQNTYLRKLCLTSQGKLIGMSRLGLTVMEWRQAD